MLKWIGVGVGFGGGAGVGVGAGVALDCGEVADPAGAATGGAVGAEGLPPTAGCPGSSRSTYPKLGLAKLSRPLSESRELSWSGTAAMSWSVSMWPKMARHPAVV